NSTVIRVKIQRLERASLATPCWRVPLSLAHGACLTGLFAAASLLCPLQQADLAMSSEMRIFGARQNTLKNLNVRIKTGELLVITGVSGSGKSSLAFDTLYAEGQRRYVETFSPYARQFLDRMDKPQVDRIEGI